MVAISVVQKFTKRISIQFKRSEVQALYKATNLVVSVFYEQFFRR